MKKENEQKGIVLYIVLLIISIFLSIVLTLTNVSMSQIKIAWQAGDSVRAFTAADTGIEKALYNIRKLDPADFNNIPKISLSNGSSYTVTIVVDSPTAATIQSKGEFKKSRRTIEAKY